MAIAAAGASALTGQSASGSAFTVNLPGSIAVGDLIRISYQTNDVGRYLVASGWTNLTTGAVLSGIIYKYADGSEGATQGFNTNTGTTILNGAVARRFTGVHATVPFGTPVQNTEASEDPFTLAANLVSGLAADSWVDLVWGGNPTASRSIVTLDGDLTLIGSTADNRVHSAVETNPGTDNAAYSIDMSGARDWDYVLVEMFAAAGGGGGSTQAPRSAHQYRMRRA